MPDVAGLPRSACLALYAVLTASGCSFMFVKGPPPQHDQVPYFQCTTSRAWPVVDTLLASAYAIETAAFMAGASRSDSNESGMKAGAAASAVAAALFAASATSGYGKASKCRKATQALQLRLMRMQPFPGAGPWPPGPYPYPYPYQPVPTPSVPHDPWLTPPSRPFGAPSSPAPVPPPPVPEPQVPEEEP